MGELIAPYGGKLVNLMVSPEERSELARRCAELDSLQLTPRMLCDLELLATGAFSPLDRFLGKAAADRVAAEMRLADGTLFPVPVALEVGAVDGVEGKEIALRTPQNHLAGWMKVEEVYAARVPGRYCLGGPVRVLDLPKHPDFPSLRRTPAEVRALLAAMGRSHVVAFQPRVPLLSAHRELTRNAVRDVDASLLLQPLVGTPHPGDAGHYARVRAYQQLADGHDSHGTVLNLLPLAPHPAGPRETLWHAIVQRNFGASHLLMEEGAACDLLVRHRDEIGIQAMPYSGISYLPDEDRADPPADSRQGFCIWFTGLPSSGKSTVAESLIGMLMEHGRQVTMLDGDVVRTHLSKGLGFSRQDRDTNILRVGFVASEIVRHQGAVVCAAVSPYRHTREQVRAMVAGHSPRPDAFVEVFVDTPAAECERRDVKGFYAQARDGKIKGFTGVDDPYEPPLAPEIRLTTTDTTATQNAARIVEFLRVRGLL